MNSANRNIKLAYSDGQTTMDNKEITEPLTPIDCDLSHLKMMVDPDKILSSKTLSMMPEDCVLAHIRLWFQGWKNVPCGSLPDDDFEIALAAGYSPREIKLFDEKKEWILKNRIKCSDGRWYHKTISAEALDLWVERIIGRIRSAKGNAVRNKTEFKPQKLFKALAEAVQMLEGVNPSAKRLSAGFPEAFLSGFDSISYEDSSEEPKEESGVDSSTTPKDKVREGKVILKDSSTPQENQPEEKPEAPQAATQPAPIEGELILKGEGEQPAKPKPPAKQKKASKPDQSTGSVNRGELWAAYAEGYQARYGIEPVRNAKTNSQMVNLVKRIGADSVPVARWFPQHNNSYYVQRGHSVDNLLSDCEKLRTEWATGNQATAARARRIDKTQTNFSAAEEAKRMRQERNSRGNS